MAFDALPALTVNLDDLGLKIAPPPAGPKVTLLGICSNSSISLREPFQVTNVGQAAASLFFSGSEGPTYPGELSLALEEAVAAGANAVEIVVIGHHSGEDLERITAPTGASQVVGPGTRYAELALAYDTIKNTDLDVVVPVGAWADCTGVTGGFMNQLSNFCEQATNEFDNTCIGVIGMMPPLHWAWAWKEIVAGTDVIDAGVANLSGEVAALTGFNQALFGTPSIDLVDEWVKYATQTDDESGGATPAVLDTQEAFPTVFANYLKGSTDPNTAWFPENDKNTSTAVNDSYFTSFQSENSAGTKLTDTKGNKVDGGRRICVVGSPLITANNQVKDLAVGVNAATSNTVYNTDGAAAYAGFMNTLVPHSATTNKKVSNLTARRQLSAKQANQLAARRVTTFLQKSRGHVVASGVTGAHNVSRYTRSDFVRLSTMRIVDAALNGIKDICEPFIGEANNATNRNAMATEIDKFLFTMKTAGALNDFEFFVSSTQDQQVLGEVDIDLTLVPAFEIVKIVQTVSLAKSL